MPTSLRLTVVASVIGTLLIVAAVVALGGFTGGNRAAASAVAPPSPKSTAAPTAAPTGDFAATACRLTNDLTDIQNNHIIPLAGLLGDWVSTGQTVTAADAQTAVAHATAAAQVLSRNASAVGSLRSAENPQLVVDITKAYEGYAAGLRTLAPMLGDPAHAELLSAVASGGHQLNEGLMALNDANSELDLVMAAGTATCL